MVADCKRRAARLPMFLPLLLACFAACEEPSQDVGYAERRSAPALDGPVLTMSAAQRFGVRQQAPGGAATAAEESPLVWAAPETWVVVESTAMRMANYRIGNDGECYLTILGGSGGGVAGNVNRWRAQMGLSALVEEEVEALPRVALLGRDAYLLELEGSFSGMGSEARAGWGLRGAILGSDRFTIFVKFTGPAALVTAEAGAFDAFCASIALHEHAPGMARAAGGDDGGAGDSVGGDPAGAGGVGSAGGVAWDVPEGWDVEEGRGMRLVTFRSGGVECYLTVLGGDGGGVVGNIQRWVVQLGLDAPTEAEVEALPRVDVLGVESALLEATGDYSGMGAAEPVPDTTMFGVVCVLEDRAIFIKMLGPSAEVEDERERFLELLASMRMEEGQ